MKTWLSAVAMTAAGLGSAMAYDNGSQALACDYRFGKIEGAGKCLVVGSGMNQGISWVVFDVKRKRFRYEESSSDIVQIDESGNTIATHRVENSSGKCRAGGKSADIYDFENGDRICLYW